MGTPQTAPRTARRVPFDDGAWDDMQELVIDAYRQTGRWRNWTPDRVDGFIRGRLDDELLGRWTDWRNDVGLWREMGDRLVAAIHPEGPDEAYLDVTPGWENLQPEMLAWSESRWFERHRADDDPPPLITYAAPDDRLRAEVLVRRGYRDLGPREILRVRALAGDLPEPVTAAGYRVRRADMGDPCDREGLIGITRAVFGVEFDDTAIALEARMRTVHEYLLAEAPDGTWAGWCGVWSVPEVGCGQFEPVGVHPHHRRLGLASAIMTAGMAWMRERGLDRAFVGTGYHAEANRLYQSLGFEPAEVLHQWSLRRTVDWPGYRVDHANRTGGWRMARPMKLGLVLPMLEVPPTGAKPEWQLVRDMALRAEEIGFDTVWIPDELLWRADEWPGPRGFWECVAMTGAVAAVTSKIEVGTWVLSALHRNPGLTAKAVETIDEISGGRFLLGLGSGHAGQQGKAFGYPLDHTIGRYEEALQIIIPLLREGRADFTGKYHAAVDQELRPRGPRPGRIPIMLGAHKPRTMGLAVRHADIWSAFATVSSLPEAFEPMVAELDAVVTEQGRDPASLGRSVGVVIETTEDRGAEEAGMGVPISGSPEEIAAILHRFAEMGFTRVEVMLWENNLAGLEGLAAVLRLLDA